MIYQRFGKRFLDLIIVIPGVVILIPLWALIFVLTWKNLGFPILFRQVRPGFMGKPFTIYKFRTMTNERDGRGDLLADNKRLTRYGRFLRNTSLDELPELFNVLKGDMSLVGPRPLLVEYLDLYTVEQMRRHEVEPGITGWAQVNGRNALSWEEKFAHDVWYVDHVSFLLDLKILWRTVTAVLRRKDISHPGQSTMTLFKGTKHLK